MVRSMRLKRLCVGRHHEENCRTRLSCELAIENLPAGLFATVTPATVPSPPATRGLRTGFIHVQCSAVNIRPVQGTNCLVGFARVAHLDKCKTSRLSRVTICHDVHPINSAVGLKK